MQDNSNLTVLVIDPNPGMRGSLQNMLVQANFSRIEFAVSSGTAIRQLGKRHYDIILCEYDLGSGSEDGQDGQQLLEDLRHHKLIGLATIFIMITSEGIYSKVVSAAELAPTDYILKPFTVEVLGQRITRAIERRNVFLPSYQLIGQGNLREAIRAASSGEALHPRHASDFARLRAELHVQLGELADAERLYAAIIDAKPVGWAYLGLARTLFLQQRIGEAENVLTKLIASNSKYMAAYDLLARCHEAKGSHTQAQRVLEEAVGISPHMVRRLRHLGEVALETGDVTAAEKSFRQVVTKARYSEFRNPEDHVNLVKTLLQKGDAAQAGNVIRDLERSMRGSANVDVCKSISVALLHEAAGNEAAALTELGAAVNGVRGTSGLSSKLKIGLAQSCLSHSLDAEASDVMLAVMNDVSAGVSVQQAMNVFVKAGRPELAEGIGSRLRQQAQALLDVAAEKANMGDSRGAVQTSLEALHLAPNSVQVLVAAAGAILRQLGELGWDHPLAELCRAQIDKIAQLDAANPRLEALGGEFQKLRRKYGISS